MRLGLCDGVVAEVEDRRGQHGARAAFGDAVHEVVERADATAGDHGDRHSVGNGACQGEVEAGAGAVAVHGGQQDLSCAFGRCRMCEFHGVDAGGFAPPVGEDLPFSA